MSAHDVHQLGTGGGGVGVLDVALGIDRAIYIAAARIKRQQEQHHSQGGTTHAVSISSGITVSARLLWRWGDWRHIGRSHPRDGGAAI